MTAAPLSLAPPTVRAHLLLQVDPGRAAEAAAFVHALPHVQSVAPTSGAYDVIAAVEAASAGELAATLARARRTPGLCALRVCRSG
jgi:hypothetical protein